MLSTVQPLISAFTGNGSTTAFTTSFAVFRSADVYVFVNNALVTTGFTLSSLGSLSGCTITFDVAPTNGYSVVFILKPSFTRDTEYQNNGDIIATTLNRDFDRLWQALQVNATNIHEIDATSYTLSDADNGAVLRFTSASAVTLTANTAQAVKGFTFVVIQAGAGTVTFTGTATLRNKSAHTGTNGQYSSVGFICDKTGEFNFAGGTA